MRFPGQYFDAETGLYYNWYRYYDPTTGRYLRTDPLDDGLNPYAYALSNPMGLIDPWGLCAAKRFFTGHGQADFWAGFGDFLTSGFELSYLFDIPSFTEWIRLQWQGAYGWNDVVDHNSTLYAAGAFAGDVVGSFLGEAIVAKIAGRALPWLSRLRCLRKAQPPCFIAGTLVETSEGLKPIEEIEPGDFVLSRNDETGEISLRKVARNYITPDQRVLELNLEDENGDQETFGVTAEHPFWVKDQGWKAAHKLLPGDEVFTSSGGWLSIEKRDRQIMLSLRIHRFLFPELFETIHKR